LTLSQESRSILIKLNWSLWTCILRRLNIRLIYLDVKFSPFSLNILVSLCMIGNLEKLIEIFYLTMLLASYLIGLVIYYHWVTFSLYLIQFFWQSFYICYHSIRSLLLEKGWIVLGVDFFSRLPLIIGRNISYFFWKYLCLPKKIEGIGVLDLQVMNILLLLKWW
jgi:hypothetical protein